MIKEIVSKTNKLIKDRRERQTERGKEKRDKESRKRVKYRKRHLPLLVYESKENKFGLFQVYDVTTRREYNRSFITEKKFKS